MARNIKKQLRDSIFNACDIGAKKHIERDKDPEAAYLKIFSFGTKFQLLDRVNDFCRVMKDELKAFTSTGELSPEIAKQYLVRKSADCSQATLNEYRSELKKIYAINGVELNIDKVQSLKIGTTNRGANDVIPREDLNKLLEYGEKNPSRSAICIKLESHIGIRVSDMAYGIKEINWDDEKLHIQCKNGKWCHRAMTAPIKEIVNSEIFQKMVVNGKVVNAPKDESINAWLRRTEDKLGLERHSFHAIRRRIAQDKFDELRSSGVSKPVALDTVSKWLNHGEYADRTKMLKQSYIANIY